MKKTLLAAIIAATALVPPAALAQDRGGRWGNRGGGAQTSSSQPSAQPTRPSGGSWRGQSRGDGSQSARPQRQWGGGDSGNWQRPAQPQTQQPQAIQPQQVAPQQRWGGNRGGYNVPVTRSRDDTRSAEQFRRERWNGQRPGAGQGNQQYRPDRDRRHWNGSDRDRPGWSGSERNRRDWNGNGGNRPGWNGNRYDNGGRWNNSWRNDRRYDWRGYRNTNRGIYRLPRYYAPSGWGYGYRRFGIGFTLNSILYSSRYWINDPFYYRLPEVEGQYRWVRYYNDALLVDIYTGEVVDTIYDIFW